MAPRSTPAVFNPVDDATIPRPYYLCGFCAAIERFSDLPYGAQLIVRVFAVILSQHETGGECFICEKTNNRYESLTAAIPELVDSEAPQLPVRQQVIDYLLRMPPSACEDVDEYKDQTDLVSTEVISEKDGGCTTVTRGIKWLVERALVRLPDGVAHYAETRKTLQQLLTPQPKYDSSRDYEAVDFHITVTTAIRPALRLFTVWPRCDEASIACLASIVMDTALKVAAIWDMSPPSFTRSYLHFFGGFVQTRASFKAAVEGSPSLDAANAMELPYHTRAGLKEVRFMEIWVASWTLAKSLNESDDGPLIDRMYEAVINTLVRIQSRLESQNLDMNSLLRKSWSKGRLPFRTSKEIFQTLSLPSVHEIRKGELGGIPSSMSDAQTIGSNFYGPETRSAFWTVGSSRAVAPPLVVPSAETASRMQANAESDYSDDEEDGELSDVAVRSCYGEVNLEAHGPHIQPLEHGAWDLDLPQDQRCVVCAETHGLVGVKMNACGHYFHLACIKTWMNSTSPNSNLCPACRTQVSRKRRKVRFQGWMDDGEDEDDDVGDSSDDMSSDDGEDEDERMLQVSLGQHDRGLLDLLDDTDLMSD
jgi:hypothetical protein